MPARINAQLFAAVYGAVSTQETRYYLNGVFVQANPAGHGILLVATDGHRLLAAHDETGTTDRPGIIVRLNKDALRACKPAKGEAARFITVEKSRATVEADGKPIVIMHDAIIDGVFPDWRRVIPQGQMVGTHFASFDGKYLADMAKAGDLLREAYDGVPKARGMRLSTVDAGSPALVRWNGVNNAFGVLMTIRSDALGTVPAFAQHLPETSEKAAV